MQAVVLIKQSRGYNSIPSSFLNLERAGISSPSCPGGTGEDHGNTGSAPLSFHPKRQRFRFPLRPLGGVFLYVYPKEKWEPAMGSTANVLSLPHAESPGYSLPSAS